MQMQNAITVSASINAPIEHVWKCWTTPEDIMVWNTATPDWHTTAASQDVRIGGKFSAIMAAKDGSMQFDFWGIYDDVIENELLMSTLGDGRKLKVSFASIGNVTELVEVFEPEAVNSLDLQQQGWQAILNNFKQYAEMKKAD